MEEKTIQRISLGIIILIGIFVIINFIRVPSNLKESLSKIEAAERNIESSIKILEDQKARINDIITLNENLLKELDTISSANDSIKKTIDQRLKDANWYLNRIKKTVEKLPNDNFDPQ